MIALMPFDSRLSVVLFRFAALAERKDFHVFSRITSKIGSENGLEANVTAVINVQVCRMRRIFDIVTSRQSYFVLVSFVLCSSREEFP